MQYEELTVMNSGFFQQFWEKVPGQIGKKMIYLTKQIGEINDMGHNRGSNIYP